MMGSDEKIPSKKARITWREEQDKNMRIIGLDYGTKTVGVAVSDALMITAQPLETIERKSANKLRQTLARIESIIEEYQAERIVLGYPKNMNNTIGATCPEITGV